MGLWQWLFGSGSPVEPSEPEAEAQAEDKTEPGLYVFSDYGQVHRFITADPSRHEVMETLTSLDWQGFHQVVLVKPDGRNLEVGGSLHEDGLCAVFQDESGGEYIVSEEPPESVDAMARILLSFLADDDRWREALGDG